MLHKKLIILFYSYIYIYIYIMYHNIKLNELKNKIIKLLILEFFFSNTDLDECELKLVRT